MRTEKYYVDGNNRGSYDVLRETNGDIKFIAEFINEEYAYIFITTINNWPSRLDSDE